MINIIIDTNLWISFLLGKDLSLIERLLKDNRWKIFICPELTNEIQEVATRPKFSHRISIYDLFLLLQSMNKFCLIAKTKGVVDSPLRDSKDLYLLSLSEYVKADFLITGDKDLLVLKQHKDTNIITFAEFRLMFNLDNYGQS